MKKWCDCNLIKKLWLKNWMKIILECHQRGCCIHVGFYVIQYIRLCELRWWASPPQMNLSPCTRVYIQGSFWVDKQSGFWPVQSGTCLQIPIERSLDLSQLMCWLSYIGMPVWYHVASAICLDLPSVRIFEKICKIWWCLSVTIVHQQ